VRVGAESESHSGRARRPSGPSARWLAGRAGRSLPRWIATPAVWAPIALASLAMTPVGPAPAAAGHSQPEDDESLRDLTGEERRQRLLEQRARAEAAARERRAEMMRRQAGGDDPADVPGMEGMEGMEGGEPTRVIEFEAFAEGLELRALVDYVAETLGLNVIIRGELDGSVVFNARQEVPEDRLFVFMESLLDQFGFAITLDEDTGFYTIAPLDDLARGFDSELGTTRIIATPAVRPSSLQTALNALFGAGAAAQPGRGVAAGATSGGVTLSYVDDLGIIIASGPPRRLRQVERFVETLLAEYDRQEFFTIELTHVAAPAARERLVELVSRSAGAAGGRNVRVAQANENAAVAGLGSSIDNLAERLTADPSSNALIFRGLAEEAEQVRSLIEGIDRPTLLVPRKYFAGSAARQIAEIASQRGLGEVISLDTGAGGAGTLNAFQRAQLQRGLQGGLTNNAVTGGSAMVVDAENGSIIYYGTEAQQAQLAALIEQLDTDAEVVVIREYKLQHANAEDVAELLNSLINNERQQADAPLLGGTGTTRGRFDPPIPRVNERSPEREQQLAEATESGGVSLTASEDLFVIADVPNNQLLVKAPMRQQEEFAQLIAKIDLRRAQVYVEATVITVTNTESSRLAVEGAIINQSGDPIIQTLFGLTSADNDGILFPRTVNPSLPGLTTAVINSDFVPFVLTAIQNNTDARIVSTPQLLVNDNENAIVSSTRAEPTTAEQVGETSDITAFGGFEEATTSLDITPSISEGGQLVLDYVVTLENFVGSGSNGIPPPLNSQQLEGSVTLPDNATVVVGGITTDNVNDTVDKIPLLGDIPLIGSLFRDERKTRSESLLYVFITPRIMRDPGFADLRLLTEGPQSEVDLDFDFPDLSPNRVPIVDIERGTGATRTPASVLDGLPPLAPASAPVAPAIRTPPPTDPRPAPADPADNPSDNPWIELPPPPRPNSTPNPQGNVPPRYEPAADATAGAPSSTTRAPSSPPPVWPTGVQREVAPTRGPSE